MKTKQCNNCKNLLKVNEDKFLCKILKINIEEVENCIFKEDK